MTACLIWVYVLLPCFLDVKREILKHSPIIQMGCMENISGTDHGACDMKHATNLNNLTKNS